MNKIRNLLDKTMRIFNAAVLCVLTLLVFWQVVTRYILGAPSTWSEELSSYLFAWTTMFGAAYIFGKREHMNIPIMVERFSKKTQNRLAILSECLILLFAFTILIYGGIKITVLTMGQTSSSLPLVMGYFYAGIPISGIFVAVYSILNIIDLITRKNTLTYIKKEGEI